MKPLTFAAASFFEEMELLINELVTYFKETYFTMDLTGYDNFQFQQGSIVTIQGIVFGICFGVIIASVMTVYDKRYLGSFARALIENEIFSPDKAQTLEELGFLRNASVRAALKGGRFFRGWVKCVEEDEYNAEQQQKRAEYEEKLKLDPAAPKFKEHPFKIRPEKMHFYMPEDKQYAAEIKFNSKGANFVMVIFIAVIMILMAAAFCAFLPDVLHLADNFITRFK